MKEITTPRKRVDLEDHLYEWHGNSAKEIRNFATEELQVKHYKMHKMEIFGSISKVHTHKVRVA